jgi:vacuolar protein sorting-associated protein 26
MTNTNTISRCSPISLSLSLCLPVSLFVSLCLSLPPSLDLCLCLSLQDVVLGKVYFLLVRIKIKHMELALIRRESAGSGQNTYNESENITKYELMDGAPIKGEVIPIRLFLGHLPLTPTHRSVNNTFSVKYYLNLVLVDEEDRRYFKQQEIILWRKDM